MHAYSQWRCIKKLLFIAVVFFAFCFEVMAFNFRPTAAEFGRWSTKCQALYLSTIIGRKSEYNDRLPASVVRDYRNAADSYGGGPWHYCSGLTFRDRAKSTFGDKKKRDGLFDNSIKEVTYTYRTMRKNNPFAAEVGVTLSSLYRDTKQYNEGLKVLDEVINLHSYYTPAYSSRALILRDTGKIDLAIEFLKNIEPKMLASSSELNYFLGIFYAEKKDINNAKHYADIAYKLGYPLPGLKNKIKKLSLN